MPQVPGREIATVFRHELRTLLLSPRTFVPMLVYAGFGGLAMHLFLKVADEGQKTAGSLGLAPDKIDANLAEAVGQVMSFVGWGSYSTGVELVRAHVPLVEVFFFAVASYFLPLLVALVTYDQFSDLSTRGARFALLRVRRTSYYVGKSLAAAGSVVGFLAAMWAVVVAVAMVHGGAAAVGPALVEGVRSWVLMSVLALPYLSVTALVSTLAPPGRAFVATLGAYIAISVLSMLNGRLPEALSAITRQAFPWQHAPSLLSREVGPLSTGVMSLAAIALVLHGATVGLLRRRDV